MLVKSFVSEFSDVPKQIVSLGAGSDPRYFRLVNDDPNLKLKYIELDLPENAQIKVTKTFGVPLLRKLWSTHSKDSPQTDQENARLTSAGYEIIPVDLRELNATHLSSIDPNQPTLLLSECCLCYLSPEQASNAIKVVISKLAPITPCGIVIYEPILPNDVFGQRMVSNLNGRGIEMPTLARYPTLESQRERLKADGFTSIQGAADCSFIWNKWIERDEKVRVNRQEMLDEVEEWELLAGHYAIMWGARDGGATESKEPVVRGDGTVLPSRTAEQPVNPKKKTFVVPEQSVPVIRGDGTVLPSRTADQPANPKKKTFQVPDPHSAGDQSAKERFGNAWSWAKNQQ
jgi:[phosphatase 2A protein]-leucine-carboxy methyltransferase